MFKSARLKLTVWYLLIIMSVSILFSLTIYVLLSNELERNLFRISRRFDEQNIYFQNPEVRVLLDPETITASQNRIKLNLLYINLVILGISSSAGYFLAGRTLRPIQEMVDDQNRFISDASHELRTPITALRTALEVNLRDNRLNLKQAKAVLKDNLEEVKNLQTLSDSLLILIKNQSSDEDLKMEKVSLTELINQVVTKMNVLAREKDITIGTKVTETTFETDQEKLARVVMILMDNAIKYSPQSSRISIKAFPAEKQIKIEVQDFGRGIPFQELGRIFNRFYRADQSRSIADGFGLGLSIAKRTVEQLRGQISVESQLNKGSLFTITLTLY